MKCGEGLGHLKGHVRRDSRQLEERLSSIRKKNTEIMIEGLGYEQGLTGVSLGEGERERENTLSNIKEDAYLQCTDL